MYKTEDIIMYGAIAGGILAILFFFFIRAMVKANNNPQNSPPSQKNIKFELLSKVQPKQRIKIYSCGYVWDAICLNNSPSEAKMFIRKFTATYSSEEVIRYSGEELKEFITLNCSGNEFTQPKSLLEELKEKLDEAVRNENYDDAAALRDTISKLENKTV